MEWIEKQEREDMSQQPNQPIYTTTTTTKHIEPPKNRLSLVVPKEIVSFLHIIDSYYTIYI